MVHKLFQFNDQMNLIYIDKPFNKVSNDKQRFSVFLGLSNWELHFSWSTANRIS